MDSLIITKIQKLSYEDRIELTRFIERRWSYLLTQNLPENIIKLGIKNGDRFFILGEKKKIMLRKDLIFWNKIIEWIFTVNNECAMSIRNDIGIYFMMVNK